MPRINPYTSSPENLSESTRGSAAWGQVGRRIGPLYNEAAQFQKEQGQAVAQGIRQMTWPWSIAKLLSAQANASSAGSGLNIRGRKLGEDSSAVSGSHIGLPDNSDGVGQISRGAAALGKVLRDGGRALAAAKPQENFTLYKGELVLSSKAREYAAAYNQDLSAQGQAYQENAIDTQNYWRSYDAGIAIQENIGGPAATVDSGDFGTRRSGAPGPQFDNYSDTGQDYGSGGNSNWLSGVTSFIGGGLQGDYEVSN